MCVQIPYLNDNISHHIFGRILNKEVIMFLFVHFEKKVFYLSFYLSFLLIKDGYLCIKENQKKRKIYLGYLAPIHFHVHRAQIVMQFRC